MRTHGGCCHVTYSHACTNTQARRQNSLKNVLFRAVDRLSSSFLLLLLLYTHIDTNADIHRHKRKYTHRHTHTHALTPNMLLVARNLPKSTEILGRFFFVFSTRIFSLLTFFHVCYLLYYFLMYFFFSLLCYFIFMFFFFFVPIFLILIFFDCYPVSYIYRFGCFVFWNFIDEGDNKLK